MIQFAQVHGQSLRVVEARQKIRCRGVGKLGEVAVLVQGERKTCQKEPESQSQEERIELMAST